MEINNNQVTEEFCLKKLSPFLPNRLHLYNQSPGMQKYLLALLIMVGLSLSSQYVTVSYPNGGETLFVGQTINLTWNASGNYSKIQFSSDAGLTWNTVADSVNNLGHYLFVVPNIVTNKGLIKISITNYSQYHDQSDSGFTIINASSLKALAGSDEKICLGGAVQLSAGALSGTPPYTYQWAPSASLSATNVSNPFASPTSTTTYVVTVTDGNSNTSSDTIQVVLVTDTLYPYFLSFSTVCIGQNFGLEVGGYNNGTNFSAIWTGPQGDTVGYSGGISITNSSVVDSGLYRVHYTYPGCAQNSQSVNVDVRQVFPPDFNYHFYPVDTMCFGIQPYTPLFLFVCDSIGGSNAFIQNLWNAGDGTGGLWTPSRPFYYMFQSPGMYAWSFEVTDNIGCETMKWCNVSVPGTTGNTGCIWPGDANHNGIADNNDLLSIGLAYDSAQYLRYMPSLTWTYQFCANWNNTLGGVNFKHIDCDGNGIINADDTVAIIQNFGQVHAKTDDEQPWRSSTVVLFIDLVSDTAHDGDTLIGNLILGDINIPADNVYGLAFTLRYDAHAVDSTKTSASFGNSWLGTSANKISIAKDLKQSGELKCAITGIDHVSRNGFGQIGQVRFVINTDDINALPVSYYNMHVWLSDILMIDNNGNVLPINAGQDSTQVKLEPSGITEFQSAGYELRINPNPASTELNIKIDETLIGSTLTLYDVTGRKVMAVQLQTTNSKLETSRFARGVYFIAVKTKDGEWKQKLVLE